MISSVFCHLPPGLISKEKKASGIISDNHKILYIMKAATLYLFFFTIIGGSFAQDISELSFNKRGKKVKLELLDSKETEWGYFWSVAKDSVFIAFRIQWKVKEDYQPIEIVSYPVNTIESIKLKANSFDDGMGLGAGIGAFTGGVIGLSDSSTCTGFCFVSSGEVTMMAMAFGALTGSLVGGTLGIIPKKIKINGSQMEYNTNLPKLDAKTFWTHGFLDKSKKKI